MYVYDYTSAVMYKYISIYVSASAVGAGRGTVQITNWCYDLRLCKRAPMLGTDQGGLLAKATLSTRSLAPTWVIVLQTLDRTRGRAPALDGQHRA